MRAEDIARALGKATQSGNGWNCLCPAHEDKNPSLSVTDDRIRDRMLVRCHAGCSQEDVIRELRRRNLWPKPITEATYDYCDESGRLLYQVVRYGNPKTFRQRRPNGSGFVWGRGKAPHVPFQLQNLMNNPDDTVLIVEGEKDVLNLMKFGFVATCNDSGAGKFSNDLLFYFKMRRVVLIPDNDEAGRSHVDDVARKLRGVAAEIRFLELPGLPPKGDVSDWIATGGTKEALQAMIDDAPPWQPRQQQEQQDGDDGADPDNTDAESRDLSWLQVHDSDLPRTANEVVKILSGAERLFERGGQPVKLVEANGVATAEPMEAENVVMEVHELAQPFKMVVTKEEKTFRQPVTLPMNVARMYLAKRREWGLRPLAGITSAPLLSEDGAIRFVSGYDPETQLWCHDVVKVEVPERPSKTDAETALHILRWLFRSFPFSDAATTGDDPEPDPEVRYKTPVVDLSEPPRGDESAALAALMTAVARPSLRLAPALLLSAPARSGSGTGKGLLFRAISMIAAGAPPRTTPPGHSDEEFDKRVVAMVLEAAPILYFDNANARDLSSNTLASLITERPSHLRVLGQSKMVEANSTAFIGMSGNGLRVTEDLIRRFLQTRLDAHVEDAASRDFKVDVLRIAAEGRDLFLESVLTIWRWGRQNEAEIPRGVPFGGFEEWARWCRDPLVALGCADPIARIAEIRAEDLERNRLFQFLEAWHETHGETEIHLSSIDKAVRVVADPDQMTQKEFESFVHKNVDAVFGPYTLRRGTPEKKRKDGRPSGRPVKTYRVTKTQESDQ